MILIHGIKFAAFGNREKIAAQILTAVISGYRIFGREAMWELLKKADEDYTRFLSGKEKRE